MALTKQLLTSVSLVWKVVGNQRQDGELEGEAYMSTGQPNPNQASKQALDGAVLSPGGLGGFFSLLRRLQGHYHRR